MRKTFILVILMVFFTTILGCLKNDDINTDINTKVNNKLNSPAKTPEEIFIQEGYNELDNGKFKKAIQYFNKALSLTDEISLCDSAYLGLGWCKLNLNDDDSGLADFLSLSDISTAPAIVGVAYSLLKRRSANDINFCIEYLESLGINKDAKYCPPYRNMFSNAEVHAILAIAYYWYGNDLYGDLEIKKANLLNVKKPYNLVDKINKEISENGF